MNDLPLADDLFASCGRYGYLQTRPSYRCGRIVDRLAYDALAAETGASGSAVFPAYRDGGRP